MLFVAAIAAPICMFRPIVASLFGELWLKTMSYLVKKMALTSRSCLYRRKRRPTYMFRLGMPYRGRCSIPMV